jgi:hypothetical protein
MGCFSSKDDGGHNNNNRNAPQAQEAPKTGGGYKPTKIDMSEIMGMGRPAEPVTTEVPAGFPAAPEKPSKEGVDPSNEDAYKAFMKKRLRYETWENSLTLYRMRLAENNNTAAEAIVARLKTDGF